MSLADVWIGATQAALTPLACPPNASAMRSYMKDVSPFLGLTTPDRRSALRSAWHDLPSPSAAEVAEIARGLWALPEREFPYAACDLIAREQRWLPAAFLADPVQALLTTTPWWDTVDALGNAAVSPLTARYADTVDLMWQWWDSGDRWLVRAAIQHQRGRKEGTDLEVLFAMCDRYAEDREFFIAKAIGWALRDVTRWDPAAVQVFVDAHPNLSAVARREATKGLSRSARP